MGVTETHFNNNNNNNNNNVEMGSFTPLVFGTNGGMGADCNSFLKRLAEKLSEKNEEPYHITITWIRTSYACVYRP